MASHNIPPNGHTESPSPLCWHQEKKSLGSKHAIESGDAINGTMKEARRDPLAITSEVRARLT